MPIKKKNSGQNTTDPKTTALAHLGIAIGSKNMKTLKREEIDLAFTSQFILSVGMNDNGAPVLSKIGSKRQYQRILHESYQFLVKFVADQQAAEMQSKKKQK